MTKIAGSGSGSISQRHGSHGSVTICHGSAILVSNLPSQSNYASVFSSVADPDPGSGAFLTPGSGMGRNSASGSGIRDEQPGSYFLELRNHFFVLKYLNSLMRIRDPGWRQFGSGILDPGWKKVVSGIRDKHPGSATQLFSDGFLFC